MRGRKEFSIVKKIKFNNFLLKNYCDKSLKTSLNSQENFFHFYFISPFDVFSSFSFFPFLSLTIFIGIFSRKPLPFFAGTREKIIQRYLHRFVIKLNG